MRIGRTAPLLVAMAAILWVIGNRTTCAEGWSLRELMPGSKDEQTRASKMTHKKNTGTQTIGGKPVNGNARKKKSGLGSISGGAKRLMSKTKSMFTSSKKPTEVRKVTGRQAIRKRADKTAANKPSGIGSWFGQKEPPPPPASIKEWLALPRSDL